MEVSINGLRRRLINDYNSLTSKLNQSVKDKTFDSEIVIDPDYIQREMDGIRNAIVTLAFSYVDGVDGFESMGDDVHFERFMPEEDEE